MIDNIHKKNLKSLINSFNYKFFENISISRKKAFDNFFLKFYKKKIKNNILTFLFDSKRKIHFSLYKDRNIKAYEVLNYDEHKLFFIYDFAKKDNPYVKKIFLKKNMNLGMPFNASLNIKKLKKIINSK